jgi:phosphoglycolate phosphatase
MSRAARIRAVLFDKDGTLLDYAASWTPVNVAALRLAAREDEALAVRLAAATGVDVDGRALSPHAIMAAGSAAEIATALVAAGAAWEVDALGAALDALFLACAGDMVPVGDLPEVLGRLAARGIVLGVASSDNTASVEAFAARCGIADLLVFAAGWDAGHGAKPDAGLALAFARVAGVDPAEIAVVGDTDHDMGMARAAGVGLAVGVLTGTGTRESLGRSADVVIDDVIALETLLHGRGLVG